MKLDERDERVLAELGTRTCSVAELAAGLGVPVQEVRERLSELADNGLVYDLGGDRYGRTESGRRVLLASPAGTADERIDTTPEVERVLEGFALGPDEADALRHAFALVRYWGQVTEAELVDAVFDEAPAGRGTAEEWWEGLVSERLAALPGVEPPNGERTVWRYTGTPEASEPATDGRRVLSKTHPVYGDVKHALESLELGDTEREAARAAFVYLYRLGEASERDIAEAVFPKHGTGHSTPADLWEGAVRDVFEALPGVERTGPNTWRYRRPGEQRSPS